MGIYEHEFDKTVKMHINSHLTVFICVVYVLCSSVAFV